MDFDLPEVTEAIETLKENKYAKAVAALRRALDICAYMPSEQRTALSVQLHQMLSYCLFHQGKYREAAAHLEEQVGVNGPVPLVHEALIIQYDLLVLYMRSEQYDRAISYCQHVVDDIKARGASPNDALDLQVVRLLMSIQAGLYATRVMGLKLHSKRLKGEVPTSQQFKEIEDRLQRCERDFEQNSTLLNQLEEQSSLKFESIALKLKLFDTIARWHHYSGNHDAAESYFRKALALADPVSQHLASSSSATSYVPIVWKDRFEAVHADVMFGVGEVALARGDYAKAEEHFTPAIALTDKHFSKHSQRVRHILEKIAIAEIRQRKFFFAEGLFRRLMEWYNTSPVEQATEIQQECLRAFTSMLTLQKRDSEAAEINKRLAEIKDPRPSPPFDVHGSLFLVDKISNALNSYPRNDD